ncbi:MAG: hypothetical protein KUG77_03225 [Nannocystaceae bacterium]|nr:hypothetical protein [Nannocystaceae bacterium]
MRRSFARSSVVLGLTLLAVPSCRVQVGTASKPATGSEPVSAAPAKDKGQGNAPKRTHPANAAGPEASVWGHFVVRAPDKMIARVADQYAPPGLGAMLSMSQVKSMLAMPLEGRSEVAKHLDLTKPFGCVVVNPKQYDKPVACAVGYEGGITQLVEDMGQDGYLSGGADYAAYEVEGKTFYFKGLGDHVGVAVEPSLLADVASTIENSILKPGKVDRDFYSEARPKVIFADAREEIEGFFSEIEKNMATAPAGMPGSEYTGASAKAGVEMYRSLADLKSAEFLFRIGKQRSKATYRGTPATGTDTAKQYGRDAKLPTVDVSMMEAMPDDAFFVSGMSFDFAHMMEDPWVAPYMNMIAGMKSADGTDIGASMTTMFAEMGDVMAGPTAAAGFPVKGSVGAVVASYAVKPGKQALPVMRRFLESYKMEALMPSFGEYVKTTYKKGAFSVAGVKADTYTITPTKKALAEMKKDSDFGKLKKVVGQVQFRWRMPRKTDACTW